MAGLNKTNIIAISTIFLASSIAFHSYLSDSSDPSKVLPSEANTQPISNNSSGSVIINASPIALTEPVSRERKTTFSLGKNENLMTVLTNLGFDRKHAAHAVSELRKVYNPKALKQGQELSIEYNAAEGTESAKLKTLNFKTSAGNSIELKYDNDQFTAQKFEVKLLKRLCKVEGHINSSFYSAALKRGVPASIVKDAISALSYDINWQHDPQSGDEFKILFEVFEDEAGNIIKTGDLKFAAFAPQGNWRKIYAFKTASGAGFYNDKGESVIKGLLATPLDPTKMRITSRFGRRTHPILGFSKMHKGIDFGAPIGTPVASAGEGVVIKAGWNGAYGNYVLIKHNNQYSTAYAHLSRINVKVGQRVRQRQNIGSVGTTGRSTGPHLHYEVICNGQQVNPLSVKQLPAIRLNPKELAQFQQVKSQCDTDMQTAAPAAQLASLKMPVSIG
ncbi:M23 family metallopeptidase [Candidatus Odyssella thessalonicensis]|uniref:M23 family metallopeptidase n=1 Tax=Candidatus Odyssella thessalonicensis TaxID=84647 RepID=UPI000225BE95|nr:peptidoglycan DD-metalloendopeptidase family protein [Candidatus Odyssella thessalonicensis]